MGFMMRIYSKLTHEISKKPKNGLFQGFRVLHQKYIERLLKTYYKKNRTERGKILTKSMKMGFMMRIYSKLTHEISKKPKNGLFQGFRVLHQKYIERLLKTYYKKNRTERGKILTKSMKMGFMMRIYSKLTHEISKKPKNGLFQGFRVLHQKYIERLLKTYYKKFIFSRIYKILLIVHWEFL